MPKKYKRNFPTKPASSAHPSLEASTTSGSSHGPFRDSNNNVENESQADEGVNDMLTRLRGIRLSAGSGGTVRLDVGPPAAVAPLSQQPVLLFPPSQHQPVLSPRARMLARARARPLPGPAAPASWSSRSNVDKSPLSASQLEDAARANSRKADRFGDMQGPPKNSFVHRLLKEIAVNWTECTRIYGPALSYVPSHLKKNLLALLVMYGPNYVPPDELQLLCYSDDEVPGATGIDDITHVHAANATKFPVGGPNKGYKDLAAFLIGETYLRQSKAQSHLQTDLEDDIPDSWEDDSERNLISRKIQPSVSGKTTRLATMTHLDLSQARFASWRHLTRDLTPHLKQLSHLSLAYWPTPSLTAGPQNTVITSKSGSLDSQTLTWRNDERSDWSEAVILLQKLGKDLSRLRGLDLEGCSLEGGWVDALGNVKGRQVDWTGTYRGLETLVIGQGSVPSELESYASLQEFIQDWAAWAFLKWSHLAEFKHWLAIRGFRLTDPDQSFARHWARGSANTSDIRIRELFLWLEREYQVCKVSDHISSCRNVSGVPQKLTVVGTSYPSWASTLVRHPERGNGVRLAVGVSMIASILPPSAMSAVVAYLKDIRIVVEI